MRILIIMGGYFPGKKYGGPPVSVENFCSFIHEECYIVTTNHDYGESSSYENIETGQWKCLSNCNVMYLKDKDFKRHSFERVFEELNPDVIYLQSLFQRCVISSLILAKKYKKKVILAPRGELCKGAFRKKYKKIPYIYFLYALRVWKDVNFQSTSDEESEAIKKWLHVNDDKVFLLPNIPSIPTDMYYRERKKPGEGKFVFLSRIHPKKNLLSAIRFFRYVQGKARLDIWGPIEDSEYWNECQKEINKLPSNVSAEYMGMVSHDEVHKILSHYDAFIFPTYSENYGHVIAEALSVGTPVIISSQTPWNDINDNNAGWAIDLNQSSQFEKAINEVIEWDNDDISQISELARTYFFKKLQIEKLYYDYREVFR